MAKTSDAQLKASKKWNDKHRNEMRALYRRYVLDFHKEKDANVIEKMDSVSNKNDYVRSLVLNDIAKSN